MMVVVSVLETHASTLELMRAGRRFFFSSIIRTAASHVIGGEKVKIQKGTVIDCIFYFFKLHFIFLYMQMKNK